MSEKMNGFTDRLLTEEITQEWLTHANDLPKETAIDRIKDGVEEFERTYNAVASVDVTRDGYGPIITINVIKGKDADNTAIRRGIQNIQMQAIKRERNQFK